MGDHVIPLRIRVDSKQLIRELESIAKDQIPYATAVALTRTAQIVREDLKKEIRTVFDRPTPYTLNSLYLKPATKKTLLAKVWLKDDTSKGMPAEKYLGPQIFSGARALKRFEISLQRVGLLPPGMYAVPGSGAELDSYGNMRRGQITKILSALRATSDSTQHRTPASRKRNKRQAEYFVGQPGGKTPLGIWQRFQFVFGSSVKPIVIFVKQPAYKKRLAFFEVAERTIDRHFAEQFRIAASQAMATRR